MVGGSTRKNKKEGSRLSAEAFHWAWSHNILQIKGNQVAYQTKTYVMIHGGIGKITKRRTFIKQGSSLQNKLK
jgi:hypothetical protein